MYFAELLQAVKGAPSRLHSKLDFCSEETSLKLALVESVGSRGWLVIVVSGAAVSTAHLAVVGFLPPVERRRLR